MSKRSNPFKVSVTIFDGPGLTAHVEVGEGEQLVFLVRGESPVIGPDAGPGTFAISADQIGENAPYPLIAAVVLQEHLSEWAALDSAAIGRMLDRVTREAGAMRSTGARMQ